MKMTKCSVFAAFAVFATLVGSLVQAGEPLKASTSELPAALRMAGVSRESVVTRATAHKVRGQLFLGDNFELTQTKTFTLTSSVVSGKTSLIEGVSGTYKYTLQESPIVNGEPKNVTLYVEGQFAGLGGGIGVNNNGADLANIGSLNIAIGGKMFSEDANFAGGQFVQSFSQTFSRLLP